MRAKEFEIKKRDPNWRAMQDIRRSGAGGQHKDKKKAEKQGDTKHKGKVFDEGVAEDKAGWSIKGSPKPAPKGPTPSWRLNKDGTATDLNTGITYNRDGSVVKKEEGVAEGDKKPHLQMAKHHEVIAKEMNRIEKEADDEDDELYSGAAFEGEQIHQKAAQLHRNAHKTKSEKDSREANDYTRYTIDHGEMHHFTIKGKGGAGDYGHDFSILHKHFIALQKELGEEGEKPFQDMKEEGATEGIGGTIAGGIGQFVGNKIDPLHGEIMRAHGEIAGRKAEYTIRKYMNKLQQALKAQLSGSGNTDMEEGRRDYGYDDFGNSLRPGSDEGNTEPPNNFAIYINGKKWKVFQGKGQYADDQYEMQQFRQLQAMAARKSQESGKKWEVVRTGEKATA